MSSPPIREQRQANCTKTGQPTPTKRGKQHNKVSPPVLSNCLNICIYCTVCAHIFNIFKLNISFTFYKYLFTLNQSQCCDSPRSWLVW